MPAELQAHAAELAGALMIMIALVARAVPTWIERWSKARTEAKAAATAKVVADADAAVKLADAAVQQGHARKAEAEADVVRAQADKVAADTANSALEEFRSRLDECEKKHDEQATELEHLHRSRAADADVIQRFSAKIEADEKIIAGMKAQIAELDRIVKSGGVYAS